MSDKAGVAKNLRVVAQASLMLGNDAQALKDAQEAFQIFEELEDHHTRAQCSLIIAQASLKTDAQAAMRQAQEADDVFQQLQDNAGHEMAVEVVRMAQQSLQAQRQSGNLNPRTSSSPVIGRAPHVPVRSSSAGQEEKEDTAARGASPSVSAAN